MAFQAKWQLFESLKNQRSSRFTDFLIGLLNEGVGLGVGGHVAVGGGRHDDEEEKGQGELSREGHLVVVRGALGAEL